MMRWLGLAGFVALVIACGPAGRHRSGAPTPIGVSRIEASEPADEGDVPDASDKCRVIRDGCPDEFEDDGCPDVVIAALGVCAPDADSKRHLEAAAIEMARDARYGRVAIVGPKDAAQCVLEAFVSRGVDKARLQIVDGPGDLSFEVQMWDGKECKPTGTPVFL